jgi:hypothetical protein
MDTFVILLEICFASQIIPSSSNVFGKDTSLSIDDNRTFLWITAQQRCWTADRLAKMG